MTRPRYWSFRVTFASGPPVTLTYSALTPVAALVPLRRDLANLYRDRDVVRIVQVATTRRLEAV